MKALTVFESYVKTRGTRILRPPVEFLAEACRRPYVATSKLAAPAFSPTSFLRNKRHTRNVEGAWALVFDLDAPPGRGVTGAKFVAALDRDGVEAVGWATFSSTEEHPRSRVVVALREKVSARDYTPLLKAVAARYGVALDEKCADAPRASILPVVRDASQRLTHWRSAGVPLDPAAFREVAAKAKQKRAIQRRETWSRPKPLRARDADVDALASPVAAQLVLLDKAGELVGRRNEIALTAGAALQQHGANRRDAAEIMRAAAEIAAFPIFGAHTDMDGGGSASWARAAARGYDRAESGEDVRGIGTLKSEWPDLADAVRRAAYKLKLSTPTRALAQPSNAEEIIESALRERRASDSPIVLRVTPGAGKSRALRGWFAEAAVARRSAVYFVPTHALAEQTEREIAAAHPQAFVRRLPRGLLALKDENGEAVCRKPYRVQLAIASGLKARTACTTCDRRQDCEEEISAVRAGEVYGNGERAVIATHEHLADVLVELLPAALRGERPRVVVDEPPALFIAGDLAVVHDESLWARATEEGHARWRFLSAQAAGKEPDPQDAELAAHAGPNLRPPSYADANEKRVADLLELDRALSAAQVAAACGTSAVASLTDKRDIFRVYRAPARWVIAARAFLEAGGELALADATVDAAELAEAFPGAAATNVDVADGPAVRRAFVRSASATSAEKVSANVRSIINAVCEALAQGGLSPGSTARVGVITHKRVEAVVLSTLRESYPNAESLHFGEERGLDTWSGFAAVITVGEPWPHKARCGALDGEAWRERMAGALVQAWGRLRPVHRADACLLVHCGSAAPDTDTAPQWVGCSLFDRDRRLDRLCAPFARYQVSAGEYAVMTGAREKDVRALAAAEKSKICPSLKTTENEGKTILLYNRINTRTEDAPNPANAKNISTMDAPQEQHVEAPASPPVEDSFGEGAQAPPRRVLPREFAFPTHEDLGCPTVPAPPRLDKTAADREIAFALIVAYRGACAEFFPKSEARKWGKHAKDISQLKAYPQLVEAGRALIEHNIPPALWAAWSFANAATLAKEKLLEPPSISFTFSAKRVQKFNGWYLSEVWWEAGRRYLVGPLTQTVLDRFRRAEIAYATGNAPFADVLAEHFGEGYAEAVARAKAQNEKAQNKLRQRAAVGEHVWCLKYARVMELAGLPMPYTRQRDLPARSLSRSAKK